MASCGTDREAARPGCPGAACAALVSALAEPVGAVAGLLAVGFRPGLVPVFMGCAAGAMIFVSVHELIPMAFMGVLVDTGTGGA